MKVLHSVQVNHARHLRKVHCVSSMYTCACQKNIWSAGYSAAEGVGKGTLERWLMGCSVS
jgi:hypothetical protein